MKKIPKILIAELVTIMLFCLCLRAATITETNTLNVTGGLQVNGSNVVAGSETTFVPYTIPFATSNNISLTNGNYQYYAPTNTTTIYMPDMPTNQSHYLIMDVYIDTNSFTIATNGFVSVLLSTNPVFSIYTNKTTTLTFNKPYRCTNWFVWALRQ